MTKTKLLENIKNKKRNKKIIGTKTEFRVNMRDQNRVLAILRILKNMKYLNEYATNNSMGHKLTTHCTC